MVLKFGVGVAEGSGRGWRGSSTRWNVIARTREAPKQGLVLNPTDRTKPFAPKAVDKLVVLAEEQG